MCSNDVHITGGIFCTEFDTYCCNQHPFESDGIHCPVCKCEGITTPLHSILNVVVDDDDEGWQNGEDIVH